MLNKIVFIVALIIFVSCGLHKEYYDNGRLKSKGTVSNVQKTGTWKWFHTNGRIYTERIWVSGKLKDIFSCFDGGGNKLDKGTLVNGNGTLLLHDIKGNLTNTLTYKDGDLIR